MKTLLWLLAFTWILPASALESGAVNLKGSLLSLSEKTIEIEVNGWLYVIEKNQVKDVDLKHLKTLKPQAPVDLWISFDAILDAHRLQVAKEVESDFAKPVVPPVRKTSPNP
jgi:hypothetical protein